MTFAQDERHAICDLMVQVGPEAPTLCEGWDVHDLACHLWVREAEPLAAVGILASPLADFTDLRMAKLRQRWSFTELIARLRRGPAPWSAFRLPGADAAANSAEYFVHHEDVRRAGSTELTPRTLPVAVETMMWRRLPLLGRAVFRGFPVGVLFERTDLDSQTPLAERTLRITAGAQTLTLQGKPSELLLYAFGRQAVAEVTTIGEDEAMEHLAHQALGL